MRVGNAQIKRDIRSLWELLRPFGVHTTEQLAALMRDGEEEFPSSGYIRLMLNSPDRIPSEHFCDRFYALKDYVESTITDEAALMLALERVMMRDTYDPAGKIRFITAHNGRMKHHDILVVQEDGVPSGALVYVPPDFIGQCQECGAVFLKRSARAKYCQIRCRREAARKRRQESIERVRALFAIEAPEAG